MSIPAALARRRDYAGPALFSYGFRPFFLAGAAWAALGVLLWLPQYFGEITLPTAFAPLDWHVHEMLFGYVAAVVAGFLLTAIPNWTGRLPIQGAPLVMLVLTWVAGRVVTAMSGWSGWIEALLVDAAFLLLMAGAAAREIIAGRKWNNLKIVAIVCLIAAANIAFHLEAHFNGVAEYATRAGIALVVTLIGVVGGRIVPSFTRNWLARRGPGRLPVPFGRFDAFAMLVGSLALVVWVVASSGRIAAVLLFAAGFLHLARLVRWTGYRTFSDRLVLILHLAYALIPVGFFLAALSALALVIPSAAVHAWTGGAIGSMTIAVMTRASLGHTGRALSASFVTQVVYASIVVAALARICAALEPSHAIPLLTVAGVAWAGHSLASRSSTPRCLAARA